MKGSGKGKLIACLFVAIMFGFSSHVWAGEICCEKYCQSGNAPGDPITFWGYVTNCYDGDVPLHDVSAVDDHYGQLELEYTTLERGDSVSFIGSYYPEEVPSTNTVTVFGYYGYWNLVSATCSATCTVPDEEDGIGCRVTGGGVDTAGVYLDGTYDGTLAQGKSRNGNGQPNRYTFGGQAGAFTAQQPQPYGEWTHHQQSGQSGKFVFHAGTASAPPGTEIDEIICSDPGGCRPSGDPPSPARQIDFSGVGTFKNIDSEDLALAAVIPGDTYHWFEVHIEDLGEPGKGKKAYNDNGCPETGSGTDAFADPAVFENAACECPDFYRIRIFEAFDPDLDEPDMENIIYEVHGYIDGGNLQIHYPTGYDLK
jgi:hypothetical protein